MFAICVAIECDAGPSGRSLWGHLAPGQGDGGEETPITLSKSFYYNTMMHLRIVPNGTVPIKKKLPFRFRPVPCKR